jgi:hypothetical protein
MAVKAVADQFAETLAAVGVKRIYSIVGDSLNGLTDAIRRQPRGSGSRRCGRRADRACDASITVEMAKGFSLYMVKAILNGRTDEIVDLAKPNLWR